jgi:two-component system LytT family sensor kinase
MLPRTEPPITSTTASPPPRMPRSIVAVLHLGYWALYVLLLMLIVGVTRMNVSARTLFNSNAGVLLIAPNVVAFYAQYLLLAPKLFPRRRFGLLATLTVLTALSTSAACAATLYWGPATRLPSLQTFSVAAIFIAWLSVLALIHMTLALVIRGFISWYEDIAIKEQLARKTSEIESALLRAKLDPHFLFNTLNNIDVLIMRDAAAASNYVNQLSDILRYVLYEARSERVPLESEIAYCERYIALQRIRVSNAKAVSFTTSGDVSQWSIAPMLLIPFVENAFKHASGQKEDNAIVVALTVQHDRLTFVCSNSYHRLPAPSSATTAVMTTASGLGHELIQQRLGLLYPERHTLAVSDSNGRYSVRLDLTLDRRPAHVEHRVA